MNTIDLPNNAVVSGFTCPANGSYIGFWDEELGRWRYFQVLGKGSALEPMFRADHVNEERRICLSNLERELSERQFRTFAAI